MSDRITFSFNNDEHDLYLFVKSTPGATREIKAFLRRWMQGRESPAEQERQADAEQQQERVAEIYELTFGDIAEHYGTMHVFLRECSLAAIKGRIQTLTANHPAEAAEVLQLLRSEYPELKGKI